MTMNNNSPEKLSADEFAAIVKSRTLRVKLARSSPYWFFHIYFADYIQAATADFQREMFANLSSERIRHLVIVSFRGSAKSTIATTAYPLWAILSSKKKFVIIASQTHQQAQQHLRNLRSELEQNALFREDFGRLDAESGEWGLTALSIPKFGAKIMCASRGQSIRGWRHGANRPDLVICDDIEDIDSVKTRESRNETYRWFNGEIMGIGDRRTQFITVGNLLHDDSLVMRLKEGFLSGVRRGKYTEYPIVKDGESMWPGMYPDLSTIEERMSDFDYQTWMREFMLEIIPDEGQVVTRSMIKRYNTIPERLRNQPQQRLVGVDLAISMKDTADYTSAVSFIVRDVGTDKMRVYVCPHPINERMSFNKTIDTLKAVHAEHPNTSFVVETNGYQDAAAQTLTSYGINVIGMKSTIDKRARLNIVADKIDRGIIIFPKAGCELLIAQLTGFGVEKHDDLMDAFTIAIIHLTKQTAEKPSIVTFGPRRRTPFRHRSISRHR